MRNTLSFQQQATQSKTHYAKLCYAIKSWQLQVSASHGYCGNAHHTRTHTGAKERRVYKSVYLLWVSPNQCLKDKQT
jgi:hypothetical protein